MFYIRGATEDTKRALQGASALPAVPRFPAVPAELRPAHGGPGCCTGRMHVVRHVQSVVTEEASELVCCKSTLLPVPLTPWACLRAPAALNSKEAEEAFAAGGGGRKAQAERMLAEAKAAAAAAAKGGAGKPGGQPAAATAAAAGGSDPRLRSAPRQDLNVRWGAGQTWLAACASAVDQRVDFRVWYPRRSICALCRGPGVRQRVWRGQGLPLVSMPKGAGLAG